jgi:hypothetical protein
VFFINPVFFFLPILKENKKPVENGPKIHFFKRSVEEYLGPKNKRSNRTKTSRDVPLFFQTLQFLKGKRMEPFDSNTDPKDQSRPHL